MLLLWISGILFETYNFAGLPVVGPLDDPGARGSTRNERFKIGLSLLLGGSRDAISIVLLALRNNRVPFHACFQATF